MEKPTKTEMHIIFVIAALLFYTWLTRIPDVDWLGGIIDLPWKFIVDLSRTVIHPCIFIFWGFTLQRRLIHTQVRHCLVSISGLMVFWYVVRSVKYRLPDLLMNPLTDLCRYMWYLFYLPMIFIPLLALLTALSIGLPEDERLPRIYNSFWVLASALFVMVITNDWHQLVFRFSNDAIAWTDTNCVREVGYYAYAAFVVICILATLIILTWKSRRPKSRRWILLPCIPMFLLVCYWAIYISQGSTGLFKYLFGDMTAVTCVLYMVTFELCIRCGLIRSNSGYEEMFRASKLGVQIMDSSGNVCLSNSNALTLTEEQIRSSGSHPIIIGNNTLLNNKPIRFGRVLWEEDVTELTEAIDQIKENCQNLEERTDIRRQNIEAQQTTLALQEKSRETDLLQQETAGQIDLIDGLLTAYVEETDSIKRRRLLAGTAVVGAYIKRYGNLLMVSQRNETADISDLIRCFEESLSNLELLNVNCICAPTGGQILKTADMLHIYRTFEEILEGCLFELHDLWVHGKEQEGQFMVHLDFVCDADLSGYAALADNYSQDAGTARFTFSLQKGGAAE